MGDEERCLSALLRCLGECEEVELLPTEVYWELAGRDHCFCVKEATLLLSHSAVARIYTEAKGRKDYEALVGMAVVCGEIGTVWNCLRQSFSEGRLLTDLKVSALVLKLHKKASCAWRYREFLLSQPQGYSYPRELALLSAITASKPQHYYAWQHRLYLLRTHMTPADKAAEFAHCQAFCASHLTDSSAFHYFRILAKDLGKEEDAWAWTVNLCVVYYAPDGLYAHQTPFGLETLSLLVAALRRENDDFPQRFYHQQREMGRNPPRWLLEPHN